MQAVKHQDAIKKGRGVAKHIPFSNHVSRTAIINRDGELLKIWKVAGIDFETTEPDQIALKKEQLNTTLRAIGSKHTALWSHTVRRCKNDRLDARYENAFCRGLDEQYAESFKEYRMMDNELYLTLIYRPHPSRIEKSNAKAEKRSTQTVRSDIEEQIEILDDLGQRLENNLAEYGLEPLGLYEDDKGIVFSKALSFLNYLISGAWQQVRAAKTPLYDYLGNTWVHAGVETLEINAPSRQSFAKCIDFKDYAVHSEPGMLNGLLYEDYEITIAQSFSFLTERQGKDNLIKQRNQLNASDDGGITQIEELEDAIDGVVGGSFLMGEYHYVAMIYGDSLKAVKNNTAKAIAVIEEQGFICAINKTALEGAYYSLLPTNWNKRPRLAMLTSKNFASFSSFHNFSSGKRDFNPWGEAVALFKTPSGQPLYFNFHYSPRGVDSFNKKTLGNTRVIGQSGSGKTVLLNALLSFSQKFRDKKHKFSTVFFDKDQGAKLAVLANDGHYSSIKNGKPTGFNPFQLENNEKNVLFLNSLVLALLAQDGDKVSATEESAIDAGIRSVMTMPKNIRRLSVLLQNITEPTERDKRENSIVRRLSKWCVDNGEGKKGSLSWVLDCKNDLIDLTTHDNYGFDGTDFLDNIEIRTPISMYLLYRMEEMIDGRRFIYFMDEAWKWVDDDAFAEFAGNKQLTIRKQNGLGVFATQMPSSLLESKIASALVQQVATEMYLPNPKADYKEYTEGFKLTDSEFDTIMSFGENSHMVLLKQGDWSTVGVLNLKGLDDALAIFSGSIENIELVDDVIKEVGSNPSDWLPVFHERRD